MAILLFGNMTIRPIDIRRHDVSAKRRLDEMTCRENDVSPNQTIFDILRAPPLGFSKDLLNDSLVGT